MYSEKHISPRKAQKIFMYTIAGLGAAVLLCLFLGLFVQLLWNVTIAAAFELPAIGFWQAIGLFILAKLFFGFGSAGSGKQFRFKRRSRKARDPESTPVDDESFQTYWKEEGKEAYETFKSAQETKNEDD
jgi:hypothetical protein